MIKIKVNFFAIFVLLLFSCSKNYNDISSKIKLEVLDPEIYSKFITLKDSKIVYSDERTLSIKYYSKESQKFFVLDKIDNETRANQTLGKHCYFILDDKEYIFYNDFINEKKQIFKLIKKEKTQDNWQVFLNNINPVDFTGFLYKNNIFIITFLDSIKFWILKDNSLKEIDCGLKEDFKNKNIKDMLCFVKDNNVSLYYILEKQLILNKFFLNLNEGNFYIKFIESIKIYNNLDRYDVSFYNNNDYYVVFYDSSKFELNIYNSKNKEIKKIGYFLNLFSLKILNDNSSNYIFYSSIDVKKSKNNFPQYYLSMIYNKDYIWEEFVLGFFDFPIFSIDALVNKDEFEIVSGGESLNLINFKFQK